MVQWQFKCHVWHVLLVLGISCCCQQESAHENGSFEVGWFQQCLNNGLSWHIVWNIASSLSNLLVMSVKLPSIYCVGKSPIVLIGLSCAGKSWPWMFQILQELLCANGRDMFILFLCEFLPYVFGTYGCKLQIQLPQMTIGSPWEKIKVIWSMITFRLYAFVDVVKCRTSLS